MKRPDRGAVESQEAAALEDPVDDGLGQVIVVQDAAPRAQRLVGRKDHRPAATMPLVDHVKEHVGGIGPVGEVPDLVDDEHRRVGVRRQGGRQFARAEGGREVVDERGRRGEEGIEAVLNRAIGDGDGQVGLPASGLAGEDERPPVGHEIGREGRSQDGHPQRALVGEIEIVDRLEKRKVRTAREPRQSGLLPVGDLLGGEHREEIAVGPGFALGALHEVSPDASGIGEMQAFEEQVEIVGRRHDRPPTRRGDTPVLERVQVRRSAPPLRAPSATWTRPPRGRATAGIVGGRSVSSKGKAGIVVSR